MPQPIPTLQFTIPSIQDGMILDCRVFHPASLCPNTVAQLADWNRKAAIVAHPYAPLGGCMDDPVVGIITNLLLKAGFVVGTFNFRGAGTSKGRTSWQGKSEQNDYISFIGFMLYYLRNLSPLPLPASLPRHTRSNPELHDLSPVPSHALPPPRTAGLSHLTTDFPFPREGQSSANSKPCLLLAGYSYGALITTLLPPMISSIIPDFQTPAQGSSHAEIRLRADSLAAEQNRIINAQISSLLQTISHRRGRSLHADDILHSPKLRKTSGVRMGGDEDLRRASHDSYRSRNSFAIEAPEMVRKSIDRVRSIGRPKRYSPRRRDTKGSTASSHMSAGHDSQFSLPGDEETAPVETCKAVPGIIDGVQFAYLLVSPLQGWVHGLATLFSSKAFNKDTVPEHEMKFSIDPTLALFGDDDIFVSVKKLRAWAERLKGCEKAEGNECFRYVEVEGAGHFWHDSRAVGILQEEIRGFVNEL